MKFAYFGYREWAHRMLVDLTKVGFDIDAYTIEKTEYPSLHFNGKRIEVIDSNKISRLDLKKYRALLFYGWSWILPPKIINNNACVCLHPSPLPRYRGGSPIQHQIINGENESAVTLFRMGQGLDDGPIYYQKRFSLVGDLSDVFNRISTIGTKLSIKLLKDFENGAIKEHPQNEAKATVYKRRKREESELKLNDLRNMTARQINDFIRALQGPYPNAYIVGADGKRVYLIKSKLEKA